MIGLFRKVHSGKPFVGGVQIHLEFLQIVALNPTQAANGRGIKWSLRAFATMRAVRLFLRARAVINFLMRAASTLEFTSGE